MNVLRQTLRHSGRLLPITAVTLCLCGCTMPDKLFGVGRGHKNKSPAEYVGVQDEAFYGLQKTSWRTWNNAAWEDSSSAYSFPIELPESVPPAAEEPEPQAGRTELPNLEPLPMLKSPPMPEVPPMPEFEIDIGKDDIPST